MITDFGRAPPTPLDSARNRSTSPKVNPPSASPPMRKKLRLVRTLQTEAEFKCWIAGMAILLEYGRPTIWLIIRRTIAAKTHFVDLVRARVGFGAWLFCLRSRSSTIAVNKFRKHFVEQKLNSN
jgi:hypothetical protein